MKPEELFDANKLLAYREANRLYRYGAGINVRSGIEREDVEQIALIGLWKACKDFKTELGFKFSTYAIPRIRGEIFREFRDNGSMIRIPRTVKQIYNKIKNSDKKYSVKEIMEEFECSEMHAKAVLNLFKLYFASMDMPVQESKNSKKEKTIEDFLESDFNLENEVIKKLEFEEKTSILDEDSKKIISLTIQNYRQREIADKIGTSQAHVSRKLKLAIKKIEEYNLVTS